MYDAILRDYPRLAGEMDDAPRIQRAIDNTENGVLCIPKGDYVIGQTLVIRNRCSLKMHPAARLIANSKMDFVLVYDSDKDYHALSLFNEDESIYDNLGLFIEGGDIDGNGLASCLRITNAHHFTLSNIALHNGLKYGLCVGGEDGHIYELICNNVYCKCTMKGLSGNIGIFSNRCDAHYNDCIVVDYTIGMKMQAAANRLSRCHIWGGTVAPKNMEMKEWSDVYAERKRRRNAGIYDVETEKNNYNNDIPEMLLNSIAFDIKGAYNVLDGCYADTAEIGYLIENDTKMIGCDFFNNALMGMKKSTAIMHTNGSLCVFACNFRGQAGTEVLYQGTGKKVEWIANSVSGSERMKVPEFIV